jgi:membrane protease YdiL (CAAX protease family)
VRSPRPMPLSQAILYFGVPGLVVFGFVYLAIPALEATGLSGFAAYLWALLIPLVLLFIAALVALRAEGWPVNRASLRERFRYRSMTRRDWLWTGAGVLLFPAIYGLMTQITWPLFAGGLLPLPGYIPTILDPRAAQGAEALTTAVGGPLVGRWDLAALYFVVLFFNIFGEEFWWRGYILPRQELAHGASAWVVHGVLWAAFHFFKFWDIIALLPVALGIAFISQRLQNNTPAVILHYVLNGLGWIGFVLVVAGLVSF